jgi:two-component system sensor histidine kinase VicK
VGQWFPDNWKSAVTGALADLSRWIGVEVGLLYILFGFLIGVLLALVFSWLRHRTTRRRNDRRVESTLHEFLEERQKSDAILADLDIGILAYSSDGRLVNSNPAALKILGLKHAPEDLEDFLARFGDANGLRAGLLLGTTGGSAVAHIGERQVRIRVKEARIDRDRKAGTIAVLQDITEAEREEKKRKEFVANVSHELKTPLTTIKTYSESLLDWGIAEKDKDGVRNDVWRIHEDSLRMERLVEDLLLLSSLDSKNIRRPMAQLDIGPAVRATVERLQVAASEKDITLACYTVARLQAVFVDRWSVERIVTNLVSNAIKYTEKGGSVTVYVGLLMNDVYVKVSDTGVGIDKEHLPRIFDRFYRVDMTGSRMFGGTGLGLSIARELAELHGGSIEVTSVLGKGTNAVLRIPIAGSVFKDILEVVRKGGEATTPLQRAALAELTSRALDCGIVPKGTKDLSRIDGETAGKVIANAVHGTSCEDGDGDPEAGSVGLAEGKG